ncbi:PREDICTED: alpha-2,8-sialyltransferase 8B-like [Branchiostoma belcheri]|uniref:Alpha-2,8-sialyltransferase 8B-like n=1 Tax=Branchiostoma belcheri TaxID=7741 RepID=A0A6P4ZVW7_BRABE|nr:PREDICTED: alpha-2,8-sialyltransferase 8B-like [Branchiostoma belcheri]
MKRKVTAFGTKGSFIDWYNVTSAFRISNLTSRSFNPSENFVIFKFNQSEKNGTSVTTTPVGHYRTCAVVGNSGILLESGCGEDIDRNDFVIRVNGAPLKTFEQDVGEKTNMTIINRRALDQIDRLNSDPHLIISRNNSIMSYILGTHGNFTALNTMIRKLDLNITITYSVSPPRPHIKTFWNEKYNSNLSEMATTLGLNTYTLASTFCEVITLYGFYPYQTNVYNKTLYYNYFDKISMKMKVKRSIHDYFHQHELLKSLHDSGALKLVTDVCK